MMANILDRFVRMLPTRWQSGFRRLSKRSGFLPLIVLTLLLGALGSERPFAPLDWIQHLIASRANTKPYRGDAVIVTIDDDRTMALRKSLGDDVALAEIVAAIDRLHVRTVMVDRLPINFNRGKPLIAVERALKQSKTKPIWLVPVEIENVETTTNVMEALERPVRVMPTNTNLSNYVRFVHANSMVSPLGAPFFISSSSKFESGQIPSAAQILAGQENLSKPYVVDFSYDANTIRQISGADLFSGKAAGAMLRSKQIVVAPVKEIPGGFARTPQGFTTTKAAVSIIAAQTITDGLPKLVGWIPSFVFAVLAAFAWFYLPSPRGRVVALASFVALVLSPILLLRVGIVSEDSNGIFLLLLYGLTRLWARIRRTLAMARSSAETKSWFLAQASHDLRQPIHAIGMLTAQLSQTQLTEAQASLVARIDRSVDGASRLFQSLLDIATIESGSLKPKLENVAINDIFAEIEEVNALAAKQAAVRLRFVPSGLSIVADRALTIAMVQNIVSNAIKYAPGKDVLVGVRRQSKKIAIAVYDRGQGMPAADVQNAKKAFFRASSLAETKVQGTGLGLAIVNWIADLMKLDFKLESRLGKGTSAVISGFPIDHTPADRLPVSSGGMAQPLNNLRVVIVDDDADALQATQMLLDQWGCSVRAYPDFPRRFENLDVLISDFDFGRGNTLADEITTLDALAQCGIPVIVVSGHPPDLVKTALKREGVLVLPKPVRPAQLRSALLASKFTV